MVCCQYLVTNIYWDTGIYRYCPPPFFLQTCSEVGEERDEFSPIRSNKPPKGSISQFVCFSFGVLVFFMYKIYTINMKICTHLLIFALAGGSAE